MHRLLLHIGSVKDHIYSTRTMQKCFLFSVLLIIDLVLAVAHQEYSRLLQCSESTRCASHGPEVRFPFRIRGKQAEDCGFPFPGFQLFCTEDQTKQTLLELPNSVKLSVGRIDYASQVIYVTDPDPHQSCLPKLLLHLNLSASPFKFAYQYASDYAVLNCSSSSRKRNLEWKNPCVRDLDFEVRLLYSDIDSTDISCTMMYTISAPDMIFGSQDYMLGLRWENPNCGPCEAKGKRCRLSNHSNSHTNETECYRTPSQIKGMLKKQLIIAGVFGFLLFVSAVILFYRFYNSDKLEKEFQSKIERFLDDYRAMKPARYSYADLKRITDQFKNELGQGTYGNVFKGKLTNEIEVAVKVLNNTRGNGEEFVNEVGTIGKIHHVNVVRLIGYCADGFQRALVYEYLPNDSLQKFISSPDSKDHFLGWKRLQHIALGAAKGIEYLHQGCDQRILHFDIKPQNVLLDSDFNPKIADFGLAKLCSKDNSAVSMTTARGTIGYIAPEVFSRNFGSVSYKSDVYSFGMLVLEMVGGRKNVDETAENVDQIYFPEWIYNLLEEGEDLRFNIEEEGDAKIAKKLAIVGLWCIQWNPMDRPSMKTVVQMLEGDGENLTTPPYPFSSTVSKRTTAAIRGRVLRGGMELEVIAETE